jgi:alkanesulfonate monooxygenase SsuD/methylene tetrahydromethanopterin reductase-like flavin-dependent oxidoreductase (luciferase family)
VVGRDEDTIRKTISSEVFIRETEKEIEQAGSKNPWGLAADQWREKALVGTPEQVSEKIQKYLDAGCTGFIPWCPDYPSTETIELFAKKVIPNFR